ncbi:hypothetical protein ASB1_13330 [Helicobacter heilmannii]|nr:hypothetical protein ASB1_13330 [Helicobacter heilmannii]
MQVKKIFGFFFGSFWVAIPLLMVYATACALATFLENDYGTPASRALIYNTWWFSALHVYLLLVIVGTLITSKAWQRRRYASLFFHSSLVFIILGAGVTRFFGFEATMHLRTNQTSDQITTTDSYLNLTLSKDNAKPLHFSLKTTLSPYSRYLPTKEVMVYGKPLLLEPLSVHKMTPNKKDNRALLAMKLSYGGASHTLHILGGHGIASQDEKTTLEDVHIALNWGVTKRSLPFKLHLKQFELTRYPGSMSPSSYASQVEVLNAKGQLVMPFRIFMNHVLDYGGYRFFQSSYDTDEQGTILSVNRDPGKNLTYFGYGLLMSGALFLLFSRQGRFQRLSRFLKAQHIVALICALSLSAVAHAEEGKIDMHGGKSTP